MQHKDDNVGQVETTTVCFPNASEDEDFTSLSSDEMEPMPEKEPMALQTFTSSGVHYQSCFPSAQEVHFFRCHHPNCSLVFKSEDELKIHQGTQIKPMTLAEENASLRATASQLVNFLSGLSQEDFRFQEKVFN